VYHYETDKIPLKVRFKTASQSLMEIKTLEKTDPQEFNGE